MTTKRVLFVVYPNIVLLDLVGPLQIFTHAKDSQTGTAGYTTSIASLAGTVIATNTVVPIPTAPISDFLNQKIHTLVIVGGDGAYDAMQSRALIEAIKKIGSQAERVCSVCSGALVLAAAGFLDGRRAVTHWEDCKRLAEYFPEVSVEENPIYIKDENVWTSAGITAGMDMALAIVAEDLGRSTALKMARSLVTHMVRSGGQSQFSPALDQQFLDATGRFDALHSWIKENLHLELKVDELAAKVNMSARNFSRQYTAQMRIPPAKAVEVIRTEVARNLLETTNLSVKKIATRCGFRDDERLRRAFLRQLKTSPTEYRQRFQIGLE
ncbi:DJ-1/PfpI family protein [uncultured Roseovarius sp.]|uniref:GlxA family transcriptional regulator n=1 Tax=uncultured Roseovarius sp. TaxID=293344 RepID=UPI00260D6348|nr:DJ-1/PfpI family protein [uncultured Roseovarius sp.]